MPDDHHIVRILRDAANSPDHPSYSAALRDLAHALVEMRQGYTDSEGRTDWRGDSRAYRDRLSDLYSQAGLDRATRQRIGGAARWHASAVLRETLDEQTLEDYGLYRQSARERGTERTRRRDAAYRVATEENPPPEPTRATEYAALYLAGIATDVVREAGEQERRRISEALDDLSREVKRLRRALR